ncbi:MAG: sugar transferase [Candidatus Promineofilum sp.]|nr:sugar transferase [Promineifilum sp.]
MESSIQLTENKAAAKNVALVPRPIADLSPDIQWSGYRVSLILTDVFLSLLALWFAGWVRFNVMLPIFNLEATPAVPTLSVIAFGFIPMWLLIFAAHGLYRERVLLGGTQEYELVFRATSVGMLIIIIFGFIQPDRDPARGWVLLAWIFVAILVMAGRFFLRRIVYALRRRGYFLSRALIIGNNPEAHSLAEQLTGWQTSGLAVQGIVSTDPLIGDHGPKSLPVLGTLNHLDEIIQEFNINEVVLASSALTQDQILSIFKRYGISDTINLRLSSGLFEVITTGLEVKEVASVPLMRVNQVRLTGVNYVVKWITDISLAIALLMLSLPILAVIAIAIRLDSPGKVIYRRRVMGLNGNQFDAFKFRTMYVNGDDILAAHPDKETELGQAFKLKEDPRVTRVGRFLRKYSLDELPQLGNVLLRQMSLVGPRMISPDELVKYEQWDLNLLTVPPGITGLWQVSGRSDLFYSDRVQLDMRYIRNWSIWLDLHILMRTVAVVLKGEGAY